MSHSTKETLKGKITKINLYRDPLLIAKISPEGNSGEISIIGNVTQPPSTGSTIEIVGFRKTHPQYGKQFSFSSFVEHIPDPTDKNGITRFLKDKCKGIGPAKAAKLYAKYKENTLEKIAENYSVLCSVGVKREAAKEAQETIKQVLQHEKIRIPLLSLGIPSSVITRVYDVFGDDANSILESNPYRLIQVKGIGFENLDSMILSRKLISPNSKERGMALSYHLLKNYIQTNGNTYSTERNLVSMVQDARLNTPISSKFIIEGIKEAKDQNIISEPLPQCYSLPDLSFAENSISHKLLHLKNSTPNPLFSSLNTSTWENEESPTEQQLNAVNSITTSRITVLTGGPGTGKTFTLRGLISSLPLTAKVSLMAPTGKAAKRMSDSLSGISTFKPTTIHKYLGQKPEEENTDIKGTYQSSSSSVLRKSTSSPDLLIIDEFSMVDTYLFFNILKTITDKTHIVLIGDVDQLPSIGPGTLLKDIIDSKVINTTLLDVNHRQVDGSQILKNAYRILENKPLDLSPSNEWKFDFDVESLILRNHLIKQLTQWYNEVNDIVNDVQILCPQNNGILGVNSLNIELQKLINPPSIAKAELLEKGHLLFREGDKVVCTKNIKILSTTSSETYVVNGDTGLVSKIIPKTSDGLVQVHVDFGTHQAIFQQPISGKTDSPEVNKNSLQYLSLAWAMTIHKSQGSEYTRVALVLPHETFRDLLTKPLLYTAVTRAKTILHLFCSPKSLSMCLKNDSPYQRKTLLKHNLTS